MADDFLKNDGRKFLELMEQLADRKIRQMDAENGDRAPNGDAVSTATSGSGANGYEDEEYYDDDEDADDDDDDVRRLRQRSLLLARY